MAAEFPYRTEDGDALVAALVASLRADPTFVTRCLVVGHAHGFTMEVEYAQRPDGSVRYRTWSDVQGQITTEERELSLDLATTFAQLQREHPTSGTIARAGRTSLLVLATREAGIWIEAPTPDGREARGDTAVDKIFRVVYPS